MLNQSFLNITRAGSRRSVRHGLPWHIAMALVLSVSTVAMAAEPNVTGQSGLVYMPDARIAEEGTLRFGASNSDPYSILWSSVTLLPRVEFSARFTKYDRVPGDSSNPEFGDFRDKSFDAKGVLLEESRYIPQLSIGLQDFTGTRVSKAEFLALSKRMGSVDLTVGYGTDRIEGAFGGLRYNPSWLKNFGFLVEYDVNNYKNDFSATLSGADKRKGGVTYAVEYKYGWLGAQVSHQENVSAVNMYVAIPLMRREFIPKIHEPKPYTSSVPQPAMAEWRAEPRRAHALVQALEQQGYKNIKLHRGDRSVALSLTHPRITLISRAIGRAARTALLLTPAETSTIRITYTLNDLPLQTYTIDDPALLRRYFAGEVSWDVARDHVTVEYTGPTPPEMQKGLEVLPRRDEEEGPATPSASEEGGDILEIRRQDSSLSKFTIAPFNLRFYFVNPSGGASYDTFSLFGYTRHLGNGLFLEGDARLKLVENVSDVNKPSPSILPHVRTDINVYRQEGDSVKLSSLLLNKYFKPGRSVYGRVSAGYYEEMFAGTGGQILYLSERHNWAVDLSVDWLKQRAPEKSVGFRDYSVVTTLGSLHYRFPKYGITTTARIGRFLAKDEGVRFEFKRRYRSGVETGIWFTHTNENDLTRPNRDGDNFRDKGLFISVPLSSMLTKDTQQRSTLAIAEATRDVGQMVGSPGDLYRMVERPLMLDNGEYTPLTDFAK
jgi:hypothetical protein